MLPPPYSGALSNDDHCLSFCLSVCPPPNRKSRMKGHSKLKIGRREAHDMGNLWLHFEVERSNTCWEWKILAQYSLCTLMSNGRLVYYDL